MTDKQTVEVSDADLEAVLGGATLEALEELVAAENAAEVAALDATAEVAAVIGEMEAEEAVADAYRAQEGQTDAEPDAPTEKAKKTRLKTSGMKPSEIVRAKMGASIHSTFVTQASDANLDDSALKALIDERIASIDTLPKKVAEKVVNALQHVASGITLSCYTKTAVELLKANGTITTKDIRETYLKRPYSPGTSSAQSSQMMAVLPFLGVATKSGNTLTRVDDSPLLPLL